MTPTVSSPVADDINGLLDLISEMHAYYGGSGAALTEDDAAMVGKTLFEDNMGTHVLVARDEATVVGLASFAFVWPAAGVSRAIYLKDLYVLESHRRKGIGTHLVEVVKDAARRHGCTRIDWTIDRSNDAVIGFYERIGGFESDKVGFRLML